MPKFHIMKKLVFIGFLTFFALGCKKNTDNNSDQFTAKIVGFDLNCSTCILAFPYDSTRISNTLGESPKNYYQTVNLNKSEFKIGQLIKVKVRKAETNEVKTCITLYPSYNYNNIYVSEYQRISNLNYSDTIDLKYGECLNDYELNNSFCFDSVLSDSRCPINANCVRQGEAIVRFKIKIEQSSQISIDLPTRTDTIINGYKFSFISLNPYPNTEMPIRIEDYNAQISVKKVQSPKVLSK